MKKILILIIVLAILGGGAWVLNQKAEAPSDSSAATTTPVVTQTPTSGPKNFQEALNANNWTEVRKYLTDNVTVSLEGSECCGLLSADAAVENLKRLAGIKFAFDPSSKPVVDYLSYEQSDDAGLLLAPGIRFSDLAFAVENDPYQLHKAAIGYFPKTGKIAYLLINPGRDNLITYVAPVLNYNTLANLSYGYSPSQWYQYVDGLFKSTCTIGEKQCGGETFYSKLDQNLITYGDVTGDGKTDAVVFLKEWVEAPTKTGEGIYKGNERTMVAVVVNQGGVFTSSAKLDLDYEIGATYNTIIKTVTIRNGGFIDLVVQKKPTVSGPYQDATVALQLIGSQLKVISGGRVN